MELIGSYEYMDCTVEAYFPEPGAEDIWTIWVMVQGRIVAESTLRIEVGSAYGVDERALRQLERSAEAAVEAYLRTQAVDECSRNARRSLSSVLSCGAQSEFAQRPHPDCCFGNRSLAPRAVNPVRSQRTICRRDHRQPVIPPATRSQT